MPALTRLTAYLSTVGALETPGSLRRFLSTEDPLSGSPRELSGLKDLRPKNRPGELTEPQKLLTLTIAPDKVKEC